MLKLDKYETYLYRDLTENKRIEPERALQIIINNVEGDGSQLSAGLLEYAVDNGLI